MHLNGNEDRDCVATGNHSFNVWSLILLSVTYIRIVVYSTVEISHGKKYPLLLSDLWWAKVEDIHFEVNSMNG